jgi:hypothetical protein
MIGDSVADVNELFREINRAMAFCAVAGQRLGANSDGIHHSGRYSGGFARRGFSNA